MQQKKPLKCTKNTNNILRNINFSSGPCAKRKNWTPPAATLLGRSHRSRDCIAKFHQITDLMRKILGIPDDYLIGLVGGSSSGAMETLLWTLLGSRGIDVFASCVFGKVWDDDIQNELGLKDVRVFTNDFPYLCDTSGISPDRDLVFCWTSTTSGAAYQNADWISDSRQGLSICDVTSAAFACDLAWSKLDAAAFSWQKCLGGEAGLGTVVLGPRAVERLGNYSPSWPIPRIFRIAKDCKVNMDLFNGNTINTPSMMCVEDFYENLIWADSIGGLDALKKRVESNYEFMKNWIESQNLFVFLVKKEEERSHNIACLDLTDQRYKSLAVPQKWDFLRKIVAICEDKNIGRDFLGHIKTEPHFRLWMGPTIDTEDLEVFMPKMAAVCEEILDEIN